MVSRRVPALLALVLIATACGSAEGPSSSGDDPSGAAAPTTTAAPTVLECEEQGYPCSLDEVPSEILMRSDDLSNDVLGMFNDGSSMEDAVAFLEAETDVVEVEADADAMRFRVDGGRGTWVLRASALATRSAPATPTAEQFTSARPARLGRVVGPEEVDEKRALVLSPYEWQFGSYEFFDAQGKQHTRPDHDEGSEVGEILSATRGYEGGVDFYGNSIPYATNVNVDSFRGWDAYDVVHIVSHGTRLCGKAEPNSSCRGAVLAGVLEGVQPGDGIEVVDGVKGKLKQKGAELGKAEVSGRGLELEPLPLDHVLLTADFFRAEYPTGLDNAFVFFNACEILGVGGTDLVDAVRGSTSVVLGWTDTIIDEPASATALALYEDLAERGFAVQDAVDRLGVLAVDPLTGAELVVSERKAGGDLRIRDVVHLLDPQTGEVLETGDGVGFEGTKDDGEPDSLPFSIDVDGISADEAAGAIVHLSVDGEELFTDSLTAGSEAEPGAWTISETAELGFDVEEGMAVTLRAWVELFDDEGISDHEVVVDLVSGEPIMGWEWELDYTRTHGHRGLGTAFVTTGKLRFEFDESQLPNEPIPRYRIVGGSLTFEEVSQTDIYGCIYTADAVTYDITPALAPSQVMNIAAEYNPWPGRQFATNYLYFDTTTSPVRYFGSIGTEVGGTEGESHTVNCPSSDPHLVEGSGGVGWFSIAPRNAEPLTARGTIEGTDISGTTGYADRIWTAKRIR
jgi:hypothetical protein